MKVRVSLSPSYLEVLLLSEHPRHTAPQHPKTEVMFEPFYTARERFNKIHNQRILPILNSATPPPRPYDMQAPASSAWSATRKEGSSRHLSRPTGSSSTKTEASNDNKEQSFDSS